MTNNHVLTKDVGTLRGFSTDSIYLRPSYVADTAINLQHFPDDTFGPRRGYQFQAESVGGLGTASYDDPVTGEIETITIDKDGNLYIKKYAEMYLRFTPPTAQEYLIFSIITDPQYINSNPFGPGQPGSITCQIQRVFAAVINGNQTATLLNVDPGYVLNNGDTITFTDANGVFQTKTVLATLPGQIIVNAPAVTVLDNTIITQFYDRPFGNGIDATPYTINQFIFDLMIAPPGVPGVTMSGDIINTNHPAAFLEIVEPTIVNSSGLLTLQYYYWEPVNRTLPITFTPCTNDELMDDDFEVASFAPFDDVMYIANGLNEVQKFDGQEVYRAGMQNGIDPLLLADNAGAAITPFVAGNVYKYLMAYAQIDTVGHLVEGAPTEQYTHTVVAANAAIDVTVNDLLDGTGWNTNCGIAVGGITTGYGPDIDGYYYNNALLTQNTLKIGDNAYYMDTSAATVSANVANVFVIPVIAGHNVNVGDIVFFVDATNVLIRRVVTEITTTSFTIAGDPVSVNATTLVRINENSKAYGNIAIVDGTQSSVFTVNVLAGHTLQLNDLVTFVDSFGNTQVAFAANITPTSFDVSGVIEPVSVTDRLLIVSNTMRTNEVNLRREHSEVATLIANAPISNNLRINIYRSEQGGDEYFLVDSPPNNSFVATQTYTDQLTDPELGIEFLENNSFVIPHTTPPISKYVLGYTNVMIYAGGKRGEREFRDSVFYSLPVNPPTVWGAEYVPIATNGFTVPTADDDITGVGVSGSSLITFKNRSVFSVSGSLSTNQYQLLPIAPGSNIGCVANATIRTVGSLLYFLHSNGVYAIADNQFFPTDPFGNPVPLSKPIDEIFRSNPYFPQNKFQFKRAIAYNYVKDNQYLLFMPCEDQNADCHVANQNSIILCYDYSGKNWMIWDNINAASGMFAVNDDLYFHERSAGIADINTYLMKQRRFYRLIDYADHTQPQKITWKSSWEDLGMPQVRKKFNHAMLYVDRYSQLDQFNDPLILFTSYVDRIPNNTNTVANVTTVNNVRNAGWSFSPWSWNFWSGYQDSFIRINLKGGTVCKSIQIGLYMNKLNSSFRLAGFQLEAIPENRKGFVR